MMSRKRFYTTAFTVLLLALCCAQYASAQQVLVKTPRPSQKASVMQTIGVTDVTITYSRPGVKGRPIWGNAPPDYEATAKGEATLDNQNTRPKGMVIVPYGHIWRTGANEATQFVVSDDVLINGQKLAAGSYSLHTVPGKEEWTIVFNGTSNQWGSFNYDEKKDLLRVKAKPEWVTENQEWLAYSFDPVTDNSAQINIRWEKIKVPFTVEVKDVRAVTLERARVTVAAAKPDDWLTPFQGANYALQNKDEEEGMKWLDQSIKAKETFQNLSTKAIALFRAGKKDEAAAVADKAIERGKADKINTANFEKRVADMKAGKM